MIYSYWSKNLFYPKFQNPVVSPKSVGIQKLLINADYQTKKGKSVENFIKPDNYSDKTNQLVC